MKVKGVKSFRAVAQTNRLPFDRFRANGDMLKAFEFSAHAEFIEA
jgi:antitoxin component of RelBE/YafQ-DinJ toxin-antitoxin module